MYIKGFRGFVDGQWMDGDWTVKIVEALDTHAHCPRFDHAAIQSEM
jgi:hypothetical protein